MLTQSRLKEILIYDPETGVFTRRIQTSSNAMVGYIAGCHDSRGYRNIGINSRLYKAHRLAWLYVYGVWPEHEIDHINGVRDDNRLINLREATRYENMQNLSKVTKNTSGFHGVSWHSRGRKWQAGIRIGGKSVYLGLFESPEAAHAAYLAAKAELHTFNPCVREKSK